MNADAMNNNELLTAANSALPRNAERLRDLMSALARRLRPFPPFLNMVSVQAIELEPLLPPGEDRGCVVVNPEGLICQLDLRAIPGIAGLNETDQVEEFQELDLPDEEFIVYAAAAIRLLAQELRRRNG